MNIKLLLLIHCFCASFYLYSQDTRPVRIKEKKTDEKNPFFDKVYWGGNLGLQVYVSGGMVDLSPNAGYKFNEYFSVGIQTVYTNIWAKYNTGTYKYTFYGAGVFARAKPLNWLFLQAEYDLLNVPSNFGFSSNQRTITDVPMAGAGLINQLSDKVCYYVTLMYEYAPNPNSPYTNGPFGSPLIYRLGFNVNF